MYNKENLENEYKDNEKGKFYDMFNDNFNQAISSNFYFH
jgi:hypothetical protein